MDKKLYAIDFKIATHSSLSAMHWDTYPAGVELVRCPLITMDDKGANVHLTVRCDPDVGRKMNWIPYEDPLTAQTRLIHERPPLR